MAELVADGLTDKEVAARLRVSERTAENHARHIREKLGFRSRAQIARWFTEHRPRRELVGRRAELRILLDELRATGDGRSRVVLVSGEPGLGKTALVRAFAKTARRIGAHVVIAECTPEDRTRPLAALRRAPDAALAEAVEIGGSDRELDAAERHLAFRAVDDRLRAMARSRPLALIVEDLQWADPETLALLPYLGRRIAQPALLIAATYRSAPTRALLRRTLAELELKGALEIRLSPLSPGQVGLMIEALLGSSGRPDAELRTFVARRSGGHPLLVEELVRHFVAHRWLGHSDATWRSVRPLAETAPPDGVVEGVSAALATASGDVRRMLSTAAVIGQRFGVDLLGRAARASRDSIRAALVAAERADLIDRSDDPEAERAFRHALFRDALLGLLSGEERRNIHRDVAIALEASLSELPSVAPELAMHWEAAGETGSALRYHLIAARSMRHGAMLGELIPTTADASVASHLERALALARPDDPERAEMLRTYAWAQDDPERRHTIVEESVAAAERAGDARGVALAVVMGGAARALRSDLTGLAMMRDGIRLLRSSGSEPDVAEASYQFARCAMLAGDPDAVAIAVEAVDLARGCRVPALVANGLTTLGTALMSAGRIEGIEVLREGIALAGEHGATLAVMRGLSNLWPSLLASGASDAELHAVEAEIAAQVAKGGMTERHFELMLVWSFIDGRWDDTLELIDEMSFPPFSETPRAHLLHAYIRVARDGPSAHLPRALAAHHRAAQLFGSQATALAPEILYIAGDHRAALETGTLAARALGGGLTREFVDTAATAALAAATELHDDVATGEWIARCARRTPIEANTGEGRRAFAEGERALRAGDRAGALDAFARSARGFQHRGATLLARTLPRLRRADLLARQDAREAAGEVAGVLAPWQAVGATWVVSRIEEWAKAHGVNVGTTIGIRPVLTARELAVARLLAEGLTSTAIAARLGIGRRTVDDHIERIRDKLGLRSRAQIARWIGELGISSAT